MTDRAPRAPRLPRHTAWVVFIALCAIVVAREVRRDPPAEAVYCSEETPPVAAQVTMLSARWCRYCAKARNWLVANGVAYCEYDIERSATGAARYAASRLAVIPQIFVADRLIVGFDEQQIERALAARGPVPGAEKKGETAAEHTKNL